MASQIASQAVARHVKVTLKDLNSREELPVRTLYLFPPLFELKIGRASQTDKHLQPAASNAWFNLKVISREHAVLRADPLMEEVYLRDTDSMHGTYLNGSRLESYRDTLVTEGHSFQLGAEIVRGDQVYKPLELSLEVDWNPRTRSPQRINPDILITSKNSFFLEDGEVDEDEEVEEDDDDIEFIGESVCVDGPGLNPQSIRPRTFSVPDSDDSESSDIEGFEEEESAPSSPADDLEVDPKSNVSPSTADEVARSNMPQFELKSTLVEPDFGQNSNAAPEPEKKSAEEQDDVADEDHETSSSIDDQDHLSENDSELRYLESLAGPDEEEEQAFNDVHQHDSHACEAHSVGRAHARLPSPSDAALPKPSWYQPTRLAGISDIVDQTQSQTILFPDTFAPAPAAPLPHFQPFGYYTNMNWSSGDANNSFQGSYDHNFSSTSMQGSHPSLQQSSGPYLFVPHQQVASTLKPSTYTCTMTTDSSSAKSSKVSINDIIDDVNPDVMCGSNTLKRKASEISTSSSAEELSESAGACLEVAMSSKEHVNDGSNPVIVARATSDVDMTTNSEDDPDATPQRSPGNKKSVTFSSEPVVIVPDTDRPRKKQKVKQVSQGSNYLKYFATAVAGATLGAVGTVFGLAALPADYFV